MNCIVAWILPDEYMWQSWVSKHCSAVIPLRAGFISSMSTYQVFMHLHIMFDFYPGLSHMYTAKVPLIKAVLAQTRNCKICSEFACMWLNKAYPTVKRVTLHELIKDYICGRQFHVEIEGYSVAYFECIAAFDAPYRWTSVKGGAHTHSVDSSDIHAFTLHVWALPLTEVQWYGASSTAMRSKYATK